MLLLLQVPELDLQPALNGAFQQLILIVNNAAPMLFSILAVIAGIGLIMRLVERTTK